MSLNHAAGLAAMLVLIGIGMCLGYLAWGRHGVAVVEKPAAPVWHDDGSLTAMRDPKAKTDLTAPSAPKGGRLVRTVEVTVKPAPPVAGPAGEPECPSVSVRLDMHAYDDGLRVSALASGGEVLDAVDIPRSEIFIARPTRNVVALERTGDATVVRYGRSIGAFDVGPAVHLDGGHAQVGGWVAYRF